MDINSTVTYLSFDKDGALWVSVMGQGVWQYVFKTGQTKHYDINEIQNAVAQVLVDNSNQVWAVTNLATPSVYRLNRLHNQFEPVSLSFPSMYNCFIRL